MGTSALRSLGKRSSLREHVSPALPVEVDIPNELKAAECAVDLVRIFTNPSTTQEVKASRFRRLLKNLKTKPGSFMEKVLSALVGTAVPSAFARVLEGFFDNVELGRAILDFLTHVWRFKFARLQATIGEYGDVLRALISIVRSKRASGEIVEMTLTLFRFLVHQPERSEAPVVKWTIDYLVKFDDFLSLMVDELLMPLSVPISQLPKGLWAKMPKEVFVHSYLSLFSRARSAAAILHTCLWSLLREWGSAIEKELIRITRLSDHLRDVTRWHNSKCWYLQALKTLEEDGGTLLSGYYDNFKAQFDGLDSFSALISDVVLMKKTRRGKSRDELNTLAACVLEAGLRAGWFKPDMALRFRFSEFYGHDVTKTPFLASLSYRRMVGYLGHGLQNRSLLFDNSTVKSVHTVLVLLSAVTKRNSGEVINCAANSPLRVLSKDIFRKLMVMLPIKYENLGQFQHEVPTFA